MARYFPVSIGKEPELSTAYDWLTETWTPLPSLSFIPKEYLDAALILREGPAGPGIVFVTKIGRQKEPRFIVSNIFTCTYKLLPPSPRLPPPFHEFILAHSWDPDELFDYHPRVVRDSETGSYNVIAFQRTQLRQWFVMIYDARNNTWSLKPLHESVQRPWSFAYLEGWVYMIMDLSYPTIADLFAINVAYGTSEIITLPYNSPADVIVTNDLVVWDGRLYMVSYKADDLGYVRILKVDIELRTLVDVSRGPPNAFSHYGFDRHRLASFYGSCILFKEPGRHGDCPIVAYDLRRDGWMCMSYPPNYYDVWIRQHHLEMMYDYKLSGRSCHNLSPGSDLDPALEV